MRMIIFGIVLITCASVFAQEVPDSRDFYQACRAAVKDVNGEQVSVIEAADGGFCAGYIAGLNEGLMIASKRKKLNYCLPGPISGEQMVRVVEKYLRENPQELHKPMSINTIAAMMKAFPCK